MPRIKEITLYQFSELSDDAKQKAINWYRELDSYDDWRIDYDDLKATMEDLKQLLEFTETKIDADVLEYIKQGIITEFKIKKFDQGRAQICEADHDLDTDKLADGIVKALPNNALNRTIRRHWQNENIYISYNEINYNGRNKRIEQKCIELDKELQSITEHILSELKYFCFRTMDAEQDYRNSDEYITETIEANEYEFLENGERA